MYIHIHSYIYNIDIVYQLLHIHDILYNNSTDNSNNAHPHGLYEENTRLAETRLAETRLARNSLNYISIACIPLNRLVLNVSYKKTKTCGTVS